MCGGERLDDISELFQKLFFVFFLYDRYRLSKQLMFTVSKPYADARRLILILHRNVIFIKT